MKPAMDTRWLFAFFLLGTNAHAAAVDCRPQIRAAICRVAGQLAGAERPCLGGEENFVARIEAVHDELPEKLRNMFCYVRRIYLEEDATSSAYSLASPSGHVIGLNLKNLMNGEGLNDWLKRKEQTAFGFSFEDRAAPIPGITWSLRAGRAPAVLLYVFLHEFGHLIETVNNLEELWAGLGWLKNGRIKNADQFAPSKPCYYGCLPQETWHPSEAVAIYQKFVRGKAFVSPYASVDSHEDFAETFFFYFAKKHYGLEAFAEINGRAYPVSGRSGRLAQKLGFMAGLDSVPWLYGAHNLCAKSVSTVLAAAIEVEGCTPAQ